MKLLYQAIFFINFRSCTSAIKLKRNLKLFAKSLIMRYVIKVLNHLKNDWIYSLLTEIVWIRSYPVYFVPITELGQSQKIDLRFCNYILVFPDSHFSGLGSSPKQLIVKSRAQIRTLLWSIAWPELQKCVVGTNGIFCRPIRDIYFASQFSVGLITIFSNVTMSRQQWRNNDRSSVDSVETDLETRHIIPIMVEWDQ